MKNLLIRTNNKNFHQLIEQWRKDNKNISDEIINLVLLAQCSNLIPQDIPTIPNL